MYCMSLFLLGLFVCVLFVDDAVYAQLLSDATGLINRIDIPINDDIYEIVITSSFDISDYAFNATEKRLTLQTSAGLSENIAEITIPVNLLSGNFTLHVDGIQQHDVVVKSSDTISFLVLRFVDDDTSANSRDGYVIDITGTETSVPLSSVHSSSSNALLSESTDDINNNIFNDIVNGNANNNTDISNGGGCLVATAAFGSELNYHIQQLRETRDVKIASTESGRLFLHTFNSIYYQFSPFIADYERENPLFQDATRIYLGPMLLSLGIMNSAETGSEIHVLTYGVFVIALNIGMYVVAPIAIVVMFASRFYTKCHNI